MSTELIISVGEARKLLGKKYAKFSDDYIAHLICDFDAIAEAFIKTVPKY